MLQFPPGKLSGEECANEHGESDQMPSKPKDEAASDNEGNGRMDCQNPLGGEFAGMRPPIPERDINKKHQNSSQSQ